MLRNRPHHGASIDQQPQGNDSSLCLSANDSGFSADTKIKVGERNLQKNFTYSFRVFLSGCRYWDSENNTWSTDGCTVSIDIVYI